jgi:serine/threonine-protein kinase RsbW
VTFPSLPPTRIYRKTINSTLSQVELVCAEIRALLAPSNFESVRFAIELLAHESLCNAVIHGNRQNADKQVIVEMRLGRAGVRLQVTDEGSGFHWNEQYSLPQDASATCGRGLVLYTLYAERIEFNHSGNQITLWISKKERH